MKRLVLLAISVGILGVLWWKTGFADLWSNICQLDVLWFGAAIFLFIPQTCVSALRWSWIVATFQPLKLCRSTELVLASSSLNVILPSKMGDVLKGAFLMTDRPGGDLVTGVSLGMFEKVTDTACLAALMCVACVFAPPEGPLALGLLLCGAGGTIAFVLLLTRWGSARLSRFSNGTKPGLRGRVVSLLGRIGAVIQTFQKDPRHLAKILALSLLLWVLHLAQFSLVYVAIPGSHHDLALLWSRIPMAIFIGLIPISFTGAGTRDLAMVTLLGATIGADAAVVLGAFATFRYLVVALAGLPFVWRLPNGRLSVPTDQDFASLPELIRRRKTPVPTGSRGPSQ